MFEFEDSKLGRVKVVNVTEARASIASIMNDRNFNYVITKNNKPIRVIVSYAAFKGSISSSLKETQREKTSSIPGFLENQKKEIAKVKPSETTQAEPKEETTIPSVAKEGGDIESSLQIPGEETDYFSVPAETEFVAESVSDTNTSAEILPEPEPSAESTDEKIDLSQTTTPEEDDYFARFRKLYASPSVPARPEPSSGAPAFDSKQDISLKPQQVAPFYSSDLSMAPKKPVYDPAAQAPKKAKEDDHRPSIQDLLRELEQEKLSGEEEEMNSDDMSKLLGR